RRPDSIAGLAEIQPLGLVSMPSVEGAVIDLAVQLLPQGDLSRMEQWGKFEALSLNVPRLNVAVHNTVNSAMAVRAALRFLSTDILEVDRPHRPLRQNMSILGLSTDPVSTR